MWLSWAKQQVMADLTAFAHERRPSLSEKTITMYIGSAIRLINRVRRCCPPTHLRCRWC